MSPASSPPPVAPTCAIGLALASEDFLRDTAYIVVVNKGHYYETASGEFPSDAHRKEQPNTSAHVGGVTISRLVIVLAILAGFRQRLATR